MYGVELILINIFSCMLLFFHAFLFVYSIRYNNLKFLILTPLCEKVGRGSQKSGNAALAAALVSWCFQQTGVIREGVQHFIILTERICTFLSFSIRFKINNFNFIVFFYFFTGVFHRFWKPSHARFEEASQNRDCKFKIILSCFPFPFFMPNIPSIFCPFVFFSSFFSFSPYFPFPSFSSLISSTSNMSKEL